MNIDIPMILPWGHSTMFIGYVHNTRYLQLLIHSIILISLVLSLTFSKEEWAEWAIVEDDYPLYYLDFPKCFLEKQR